MSNQQTQAQRRDELLALCQQQRMELAAQVQTARNSLTALNTGASLISQIKKKPWLLGGLALAVIVIKPRRIRTFFQKSFLIWQAWRTVAPAVQKLIRRS